MLSHGNWKNIVPNFQLFCKKMMKMEKDPVLLGIFQQKVESSAMADGGKKNRE